MKLAMDIAFIVLAAGLVAAVFYSVFPSPLQRPEREVPKGFIVHSKVVHSRLLPAIAAHSFAYPTLSFLVSLSALEKGSLDLWGGWLFGYGGLYGRVTGLRASAYLKANGDPKSIKKRLKQCIEDHGFRGNDLDDAWMLTMPSYFGLEGINPLTVYFCYRNEGDPWLVILEIHNTFGEKHVHVLQTAACDPGAPSQGFSHQWTFRREFHVSPFNDRSGYYEVSVNVPLASSLLAIDSATGIEPRVRVLLYTEGFPKGSASVTTIGPLKLAAYLTPRTCAPLTSRNLLKSLALRPITLLLSLPRIIFQAWILHYRKRLNVYIRPEPHPASDGWGQSSHRTGGVGWQPETWIDGFARKRCEAFLGRRTRETRISVTFVSANPAPPQRNFHPERHSEIETPSHETLTVSFLSTAFFTMLLMAPSPLHAMLLCSSSAICHISSEETFRKLFADERTERPDDPWGKRSLSLSQRLRVLCIPSSLRHSRPDLKVPSRHPLDPEEGLAWAYLMTIAVVAVSGIRERLEENLYRWLGARFVTGQEPWTRWERALKLQSFEQQGREEVVEGGNEEEYRLGSYRD